MKFNFGLDDDMAENKEIGIRYPPEVNKIWREKKKISKYIHTDLLVSFCCFGHLQTVLQIFIFIATSFRSKRFLFRWNTNLD